MLLNYETVKLFTNESYELAGYGRAIDAFQVPRAAGCCCGAGGGERHAAASSAARLTCCLLPPRPSHLPLRTTRPTSTCSWPASPCSTSRSRPWCLWAWPWVRPWQPPPMPHLRPALRLMQCPPVCAAAARPSPHLTAPLPPPHAGLVVCVKSIVRGELTVGDAVLFLSLMSQLVAPLAFFGSYYRQVGWGGGGAAGPPQRRRRSACPPSSAVCWGGACPRVLMLAHRHPLLLACLPSPALPHQLPPPCPAHRSKRA